MSARIIPTALALIVSAFALIAQEPASIQGVVTDASGTAIPAATISLSGPNTQKTVQTAADGTYSFPGLTSGDFTLKVDYPGLETLEKRIAAAPGKAVQVPFQLRLRISTEPVNVTGDRGPELSLDPGENASSTVVKGPDLDALPDNPDDLLDMLQALAGPAARAFGAAQILVDGFSGGQLPPKNTIKEIKINQNQFSSDRDAWWRSAIEIVTKPGADKFHGSAGLADSDAFFNSRNPYAANKADYLNRMFTADAGDSFKNRASYIFSFYQNTINNTALIDAVTLVPATLAPTPVRSTVVVPRDDISGSGRLDYKISENHTFTGTYRYLRSHRDNNGVGQYSLESVAYPGKNTTSEVHLTETATINSNVVTETRFGYTRNGIYQYGDTSTPALIVSAAFNGGSSQTGQTSHVNTLAELQSNTTVVHSAHTFRFGGRLRYNPITDIAPSNFGGTFSFFGVTNAPVLGANNQPLGNQTAQISSLEQYRRTLLFESLAYPSALIRSLGGGASQFSIAAGNPLVRFSQTDLGVYINDDWRALPNLTISFGLRYEIQTNIRDAKDFEPRIALAWSPGAKTSGPPKTVFRVGTGIFYNRVEPVLTQEALRFNGVTEHQYVLLNPDFYPLIPPVGALAGGQSSTTYRLDPRMQALFELFTMATVERQLPGKTSLAVTYSNQRTAHMPQTVNINAPLPDTYAAGQPLYPYGQAAGNIFQYESGGIQKVQWLDIHVNSKLSQKISFNIDYSLWDAHNNGGWDNVFPSNPYNFNADWGRAPWTGKHYLNVIGTLTAPGGLQFSPLLIARAGQPYNLTIGSDRNGDTVANDRPAFATDLSRPSVVVTKFGAFDTNPLPGQTLVPQNYLTSSPSWFINLRVSRTFGFGRPKEAPPAGYKGPAQLRYALNFNVDVNNILNHLNPGGYVGNLSSPLFGQSTAMNNGFNDTSNNRKVQFGTQFTF